MQITWKRTLDITLKPSLSIPVEWGFDGYARMRRSHYAAETVKVISNLSVLFWQRFAFYRFGLNCKHGGFLW